MNRSKSILGTAIAGFIALNLLSACSSVTDVTRERVARGDTAVQQAQQTLGNSEAGALELQRAKSKMEEAHHAIDKKDGKQAERSATQAELSAQLAVAKGQSSAARKAADELLASIQQLRQEAQRETAPPR